MTENSNENTPSPTTTENMKEFNRSSNLLKSFFYSLQLRDNIGTELSTAGHQPHT